MDFNDFTLFDVFWKNHLIYLILSINNNIVDESKLNVYLNKTKIKLKQKIIKDAREPTLLFMQESLKEKESQFKLGMTLSK